MDLRANQHDWGYLTTKTLGKETLVYAQVLNWPLDRILRISGIKSTPSHISTRIGATETNLKFEQKSGLLHINLPAKQTDPFVSTISLTYEGPLRLDKDIVAESTFGGFALNSTNALNQGKLQITQYDGKKPQHIHTKDEAIEWEIDFPKVGVYKVDVSAHNPNQVATAISIQIGSQYVSGKLDPHGKMVVEPNENNYTDEFVNTNLGIIKIDHTGRQKIKFQKNGSKQLWLNSIWIEENN
ncbi:hypothetical protein D3C72_1345510 [compost metagenome]